MSRYYHKDHNPWQNAPPWALELFAMMELLLLKENAIMSVQDDLATAVQTLTDNVAANDVAVQAEIAALMAAIAANDTTAIQASIDKISAASGAVAAETKALSDSLAPVTPTPVPTPVADV